MCILARLWTKGFTPTYNQRENARFGGILLCAYANLHYLCTRDCSTRENEGWLYFGSLALSPRTIENSNGMNLLEERILRDGRCLDGGLLKVDGFINHQMDPALMMEAAKELARRFADSGANKILTIEASGIAPAIMTGYVTGLPVVFAKKKKPSTMADVLVASVYSFTKQRTYDICVSGEFLGRGDRLLFIDDFLANGNAAKGIISLAEQAGAELVGMGFLVEKAFQQGGDYLRGKGIRVESLAVIESLDDCKIRLKGQ